MKKPSFIIVVLVMLSCCLPVYSQTAYSEPINPEISAEPSIKSDYERETVFLNGNLTKYTKNKEKKKIGLFCRNIKKEFDSCSVESREEMAKCIKHRKRGSVLLTVGGVVMFAGLIVLPVVAGPLALGLAGGGLVPYFTGAFQFNRSQQELQKAIWLHNRDVLLD